MIKKYLWYAQTEYDTEEEIDILTDEEVEPPWRVLIHNDDVTPYDFVILVLVRIFEITPLIAEHITYTAHTKGEAYVASYPKTEAQRRVGRAHFAASVEGFPLRFTAEPE
ncbi:MAG TPA: ATP-dependent Clp protease adaptor ClpS [Anaerolineae bacterium]|nr:ATP-dependent Clp protease adaptor ClpS [Anaerolineae bacterium]